MSAMTKPLSAMGSGIDAVTEHLDPRAVMDKLDPRPLVDLVDKVDPRAVVHKLDPRSMAKPKARRSRWPLLLLAAAGLGGLAFWLLRNRRAASAPAMDTATGTDPDAKYDQPGYEDKSLGQAVNADMDLADELIDEEHGDLARAEQRFADESSGAPALRRQSSRGA
ncbi:MAG TPA: hypothetical protein VGO03_20390 [Acidimicrobiia bacterium]|jgi:hypothetical protein